MLNPISSNTVDDATSHVFYVTSWGYGADHWFSWFVKALNANPEIMTYLANEGSRPKYFPEERTRAQRPDLIKFTRFMADVGMTYQAIGDCYSYRPTMMHAVLETWPDTVPVIHLTRHPYAWLYFHVRWRTTNMRMLGGEQGPLDHEWLHGCDHDLFNSLGLKPYTKDDIEIWTTYQGMWKMNDVASDAKMPIRQIPIEDVTKNRALFHEIISFITHGRVTYDEKLLDLIYSWVHTPFRGEEELRVSPRDLRAQWPQWKALAFEKLVSPEAKQAYRQLGYKL
ncbi:hypothetical protein [Varunaivibrio sulfuroxidans]|uniref:Sulfotransferase family protein n=1 Tax=Varunaivibrio sulfuroxidans TaxID=1773489 RepID=A0A4R3JFT4_9PROT|nr:hypothetical protein [Varunaivibrio sulfuroxidans]TCS64732.1 hypothetical protein EDD55_10158 [Varunaivibrio sulfuroxidans]WES29963.1 hypothetical protein P3M64_09975 [Varunaivibrio sulfuroxidans]